MPSDLTSWLCYRWCGGPLTAGFFAVETCQKRARSLVANYNEMVGRKDRHMPRAETCNESTLVRP